MKPHISAALSTFNHGCDRARGLKTIYDYLKGVAPPALDCDDILRSAVVQVVSSFDLLMHDVIRLEVIHRLTHKQEVQFLKIPFATVIADGPSQLSIVDQSIRDENCYKSFVAPDKVAECLRPLIDKPWDRIAQELNESPSSCKSQLKSIVALRNRIAHEADVNPNYGGIELWPIYPEDVTQTISFLRKLGASVCSIVD